MTRLRQRMLEELQRRNYFQHTTRSYIHAVEQFAEYFSKSPEKLGAKEIPRYQLYLLNEKKCAAGSVKVRISALLFFYKKVLKRHDLSFDDLVYPKNPSILQHNNLEVARHFGCSGAGAVGEVSQRRDFCFPEPTSARLRVCTFGTAVAS